MDLPSLHPRPLSRLGPGTDAGNTAISSSLQCFPRKEKRQTPRGANTATQSTCSRRALARPPAVNPPQGTRLLGPFHTDEPSLRAEETARGLVATRRAGPEPRLSGRPGPMGLLGSTEPATHSLERPRLPAQGDAGCTPASLLDSLQKDHGVIGALAAPSRGVWAPRRGLLTARPRTALWRAAQPSSQGGHRREDVSECTSHNGSY